MNETEIVEWLRDERSGRVEDVLQSLRARPEAEAEAILQRLAKNREGVVRAWAAWAASRTLRDGAAALLERLLDDPDPDVRDVAVEELQRVDPSRLKRELPRLLRKLHSRDMFEPVTALWALAELRATEARDDVERIIQGPFEPFHGRVAEIVLAVIDGDEEAIAERLEAHDHEAVPWLAHAASILRTPRLRRVLERLAASAPDDECRGACADALGRWRQNEQRRPSIV